MNRLLQDSFVATPLNCFKYCYLTVTIQFDLSNWLSHN